MPPVVKTKAKRNRGVQPGPPPHLEKHLPAERVAVSGGGTATDHSDRDLDPCGGSGAQREAAVATATLSDFRGCHGVSKRGIEEIAKVEDMEATNNFMERLVRLAVLWRRRSFGCNSESGCRFVEHILTVVQTCRLKTAYTLIFDRGRDRPPRRPRMPEFAGLGMNGYRASSSSMIAQKSCSGSTASTRSDVATAIFRNLRR